MSELRIRFNGAAEFPGSGLTQYETGPRDALRRLEDLFKRAAENLDTGDWEFPFTISVTMCKEPNQEKKT